MTHVLPRKAALWAVLAVSLAVGLSGCFNVTAADLFLVQRTGQGRPFMLLLNDGGTIACNNDKAIQLPDALLLRARDLATAMETYVHSGLPSSVPGKGVFRWRVELPDGTITFPDTAAGHRPVFAQVQQFSLQAAQQVCHLTV